MSLTGEQNKPGGKGDVGGGGGGGGKAGGDKDKEKKKKESIVDLSKFIDKHVRVKFQGGREASGQLKGYDALLNLVLDNATEYLRVHSYQIGIFQIVPSPNKPPMDSDDLLLVLSRDVQIVAFVED